MYIHASVKTQVLIQAVHCITGVPNSCSIAMVSPKRSLFELARFCLNYSQPQLKHTSPNRTKKMLSPKCSSTKGRHV